MEDLLDITNTDRFRYYQSRENAYREWLVSNPDYNFYTETNRQIETLMRNLERELHIWVGKFADKQEITIQDANLLVSRADMEELARKAEQYVREKNMSAQANQEMDLYNLKMRLTRAEYLMRQISLEIYDTFGNVDSIMQSYLKEMTVEELRRQAGILGMTITHQRAYENIVRVMAMSPFQGKIYSDRLWNISKDMQGSMYRGLYTSLLAGYHPSTWVSWLREYYIGEASKATHAIKRLAVTESARGQSLSQKMTYLDADLEHYTVICEPTACPVCTPYDGKVLKVSEFQVGLTAPPFHPWCRCSTSGAVLKEEMDQAIEAYRKEMALLAESKQLGDDFQGISPETYRVLVEDIERTMDSMSSHDIIAQNGMLDSDLIKILTTEEINAITDYSRTSGTSGTSYREINKYLRHGKTESPNTEMSVDLINSALSKTKTKTDLVITRGIEASHNDLARYIGTDKPGMGSMRGFSSATIDRTVSAFYSEDGEYPITLELLLPAGSNAMLIRDISQFSNEEEVLLPQNTQIEVVTITELEDGGYHVQAVVRQ